MSQPRQVRWAIAGFGAGGRIFQAPLISMPPEIDLVAVVTRNAERRAEVTRLYPGVVCVDAVEDLPTLGVDGVTVCTPSATHSEIALRALDTGLHVVVDKPFALTASTANAVVQRAAERGRLLSVFQNRRWDGDYLTVRRLIEDGSLGHVHRMVSRMDRFRPVKSGWSGGTPEQGGGVLLDLGPHLIDQAVQLFGPVRAVHAELAMVRPGAQADDDMELHLTHIDGVHSTLAAGMASAAAGRRFLVNGSDGGFYVRGVDPQETALKAGGSPATLGANWGVSNGVVGHLATADAVSRIPLDRGRWDLFYGRMARAVLGEDTVPVDPEDAVHTAAIIDAARISATEERVVRLLAAEIPDEFPTVTT